MAERKQDPGGRGGVPLYFNTMDDAEALLASLQGRIEKLEAVVHNMQTDSAVNAEKQRFIEERFNKLDGRLDKIDGHVSRLVWLLIAAIVGSFMSFVVRGGLIGA